MSSSAKKSARVSVKKPPNRTGMFTVLVPAILVAVAVLVTAVLVVRDKDVERDEAASAFSEGADQVEGLTFYDDLSRNHVEGSLEYEQTPPAGGDHNPTWVNCGVYDSEIPAELAVHSLEHGAVWLTYRPDAGAAVADALSDLADGNGYVLVSPVEDLPSPVVATAWGTRLEVEDVSDPKLEGFVTQFAQGPQTPEPGAPCTGGVDL